MTFKKNIMRKLILPIIFLLSVSTMSAQNDFIAPIKSKFLYKNTKYKAGELGSIMMSDSLAYQAYQSSRVNAKWSRGLFISSVLIYSTSVLATGFVKFDENGPAFGLSLVSIIAGIVTHQKAVDGLHNSIDIFNNNKKGEAYFEIGNTHNGVGLSYHF